MGKYKENFDHLKNNLDRISEKKSILNKQCGEKVFLALSKGNYKDWLEQGLKDFYSE